MNYIPRDLDRAFATLAPVVTSLASPRRARTRIALLFALAAQACAPSPGAPPPSAPESAPAPAHPAAAPPPARAASYATMQPVAQYTMSPADEIALARSAAPPSISAEAGVLVLGVRGYETAVEGKNGFVCFVERSWANRLDNAELWNPRMRAPNCYNAPAVRTVLPPYLRRTEWVLAGASRQELVERTKAALARKEVAAPEPGSLSYMMSVHGQLNDADGHWHPHVMFFVPGPAAAGWGANLPGSPILAQEADETDPVTVFFIPVRRWSDGTPGPALQ